MTDADKWDGLFGAIGGRIFTLGAIFIAIAVLTVSLYLSPQLLGAPENYAKAHHGDIDQFIRAGELAVAGRAGDAYNRELFAAPFNEASKGLLWYYPPHAFLFAAPLGLFPYQIVRPLWIALTIGAMALIGWRAGPRGFLTAPILVLSPACFAVIYFLQPSAFVAAGLTAALLLSRRRPVIAGIILGILTIKPQYGLLAPVFLIATGQWRVIAAAAATTLALFAISTVAFGAEIWRAYFASFETVRETYVLLPHPGTASLGQLATKLGASPPVATAAQFLCIAVAAVGVYAGARKLDYKTAAGFALLLSLAASPSIWAHDWPLAAAALAVIARARGAWPPPVQAAALALWVTPVIPLFGFSAIAAPIILFAFCVIAAVWLLGAKSAAAGAPA